MSLLSRQMTLGVLANVYADIAEVPVERLQLSGQLPEGIEAHRRRFWWLATDVLEIAPSVIAEFAGRHVRDVKRVVAEVDAEIQADPAEAARCAEIIAVVDIVRAALDHAGYVPPREIDATAVARRVGNAPRAAAGLSVAEVRALALAFLAVTEERDALKAKLDEARRAALPIVAEAREIAMSPPLRAFVRDAIDLVEAREFLEGAVHTHAERGAREVVGTRLAQLVTSWRKASRLGAARALGVET